MYTIAIVVGIFILYALRLNYLKWAEHKHYRQMAKESDCLKEFDEFMGIEDPTGELTPMVAYSMAMLHDNQGQLLTAALSQDTEEINVAVAGRIHTIKVSLYRGKLIGWYFCNNEDISKTEVKAIDDVLKTKYGV